MEHSLGNAGGRRGAKAALCTILMLFAGSNLGAQTLALQSGTQFGSTGNDAATRGVVDAAGNAYVVGSFSASIDVDPGAGTTTLAAVDSQDAFVASYDVAGGLRWAFSLGGLGNDQGTSAVLDNAGNLFVRGRFAQTVDLDPGAGVFNVTAPVGTYQLFFAKYSPTGVFLWGFALPVYAWGPGPAIDGAGNMLITGYFARSFDADPGTGTKTLTSNGSNPDMFVAKYGPTGALIWAFRVGGTGGETAYSVAADSAGNVYVTGSYNPPNGTAVNFNPSTSGKKVNLTSAGGYDMYVAKYTAAGAIVWAFSIGSAGTDQGIAITTDGTSIAVAGMFGGTADVAPGRTTVNLTANSRQDALVAKYTVDGAYVFAVGISQVCACQGAWATSVALDGGGGVYATGNLHGTADFDPSSATTFVSSASATSINGFLASYSSSGALRTAFAVSSASGSQATSVAFSNGDVYVTGAFGSTVDLDPSESSATLTSVGGSDGYLAVYSPAAPVSPATQSLEDGAVPTTIPRRHPDGVQIR